jgi:DNA helicase HerA-like ATPase
MSFTASEQATLNFYQWEYRHRGYYHFDTPVDIEVPYLPFRHTSYSNLSVEDDGRVPSLFKRVTKLLSAPKQTEEQTNELIELEPRFLAFDDKPPLAGISITFPKQTEILSNRNIEFLNMLSFTEHLISFEIIGTVDDITVQIACSKQDRGRIQSHLKAYFPTAIIHNTEIGDFGFSSDNDIAVCDFGLNSEYMRSISTTDSLSIDPLTSIIATMESIQDNDIAVFQILFKGITSPLAKDIPYSVSDGSGGSFFTDAPEMPSCAKDKVANPLFSVVMRIATQGKDDNASQYLARELARSITALSTSEYNKLIPLSNEGYDYDFHYYNLHNRLSNRLGFILNSKELNTFLHYPNKSVVSKKLGIQGGKTKELPVVAINQKYLLGFNEHNGIETQVMLNDEMRLRHTHIIGATGVGKSTLIANMLIEDIKQGNGCALFDPHGDIVEDILARVPENRRDDVILIDPSDNDYAIGFNLLVATTDAEKIVLSSDLVSSFKRHATAWGDNMSAVLSNAVNTFLESSRDGTLIELKRFLLEEKFRNEFLTSVEDPSILYYWNNEYAMVRKGIAPLLTRIDTFLRPKILKYMLAQTKGVDFRACIEEKKIVLIKLSQGLIGEENSFLLGSIFLSKFNQVAQGRQSLPKHERHPYYIYLDEFQNFITPSITRILSGARKYGLGLILAHQELAQIDDTKTLNSVISNPYIRICFRLGDIDAKKLESGFSYFEQSDLQGLDIGQAIVRVGGSNSDFNISTLPLSDINTSRTEEIKQSIIEQTRSKYAQPKNIVENILTSLLPIVQKKRKGDGSKEEKDRAITPSEFEITKAQKEEIKVLPKREQTPLEAQKESYLKQEEEKEQIRKHRAIQDYIKTLASQRGFVSSIEKETSTGGRIDIALVKNDLNIAFEISITNSIDYEVQNIQKCIEANCTYICMVSESDIHLRNIKKRAQENIPKDALKKVRFMAPSGIMKFLDSFENTKKITKRVHGYRVQSSYVDVKDGDINTRSSTIKNIVLKSLGKDSKKMKK